MSKIVRNIPDGLEASYADIKLDTISDLVNLTGTPPEIALVSGYHTKGDGSYGSHIFEWDPNSTEPHNGGTIIELGATFPNDWSDQTQLNNWYNYNGGSTGRYKLRYDDAVNVKWFGAKGDGIMDDTTPIQSAINSHINIFIPAHTFLVDKLVASNDLLIDGYGIIKKIAGTTGTVISSSYNLQLKNITIDQNAANCPNTASNAYSTDNSIYHNGDNIYIENVTCKDSVGANINLSSLKNVVIKDCTINGGWLNVRFVGDTKCNVSITRGVFSNSTKDDGIQIIHSHNVLISDTKVDNSYRHNISIGGDDIGAGQVYNSCENVKIVNNTSSNSQTGSGIVVSLAVKHLNISNNICYDNLAVAGIQVDVATHETPSTSDVKGVISNNTVFNTSNYSISGIIINAGINVVVSGNTVSKAKQMLLLSNRCIDISINGNLFSDCLDGYFISTDAPKNLFISNNVFTNIEDGSSYCFAFTNGNNITFDSNSVLNIKGQRGLFRIDGGTNISVNSSFFEKTTAGTSWMFNLLNIVSNCYIIGNTFTSDVQGYQYYMVGTSLTANNVLSKNNVIKNTSMQFTPNRYMLNTDTAVGNNDTINGVTNYTEVLSLQTGTLTATSLPTSDPAVVGQLWNNGGIVTVSAG